MTKLTVERLNFFVPKEADQLLSKLRELLRDLSIDCYIVGGFVRDGILGRMNRDIDVAVAGDATVIASEVARAFRTRMVSLNEINQIARVVFPQKESSWHIDFAPLRGTIENDLSYRDFTINAIAMNIAETGHGWAQAPIIDPQDGCSDLRNGVLRAIADDVFQQDPVRLLRAIRFSTILDLSMDPATEALVQRDCNLVTSVSAERIRDELCYMLEAPRAYDSLRHLDRLGLLEQIMPELTETKGTTQPKEHFWDVFDHSLETVAAVERLIGEQVSTQDDMLVAYVPWSSEIAQHFSQEIATGHSRGSLLKLAGLLHDLGKPVTKTIEADGRMRFLGHAKEGAVMVTQLMERLRFSNREIKLMQSMVEHHLRPGYLVSEQMPSRHAVYKYFRDTGDAGIDTLFLSLADHLAARGPMLDLDQWRQHTETARYMLDKWFQEQTTVLPPRLIDGHTLINTFELAPGPQIGELLELVREAQAAGEIETAEEALNFVSKRLGRNL